nr:hypothetical protein [Tanacetum cinerariifolium]
MLTSDSSNNNKGVSNEGPSITSIPNEGSSIARQSKESISKELLEWYGYDMVKDYLLIAKKPIPKDNIVKKFRMRKPERCANKSKGKRKNHLVEIQANDHDLLVNSDNENDDMLGYEYEKYSDDEDADETNHSDLKLVKRDITRLYKFRKENDKPDGIKIKKSARRKMARSKNVYHHKMGRGGYVFVKEIMIENREIKADEEPPRSIMWLKGRVNKDGEFTYDEIRLVGDKLKKMMTRSRRNLKS